MDNDELLLENVDSSALCADGTSTQADADVMPDANGDHCSSDSMRSEASGAAHAASELVDDVPSVEDAKLEELKRELLDIETALPATRRANDWPQFREVYRTALRILHTAHLVLKSDLAVC